MNPLEDFFKYARETTVKPHTRKVDGKVVHVSGHQRDLEDEIAAKKEESLRARQAKELEMWRRWKEGGMQQKDLAPLLRSFRPMIRARVNMYAHKVRIPPSAIDLNFQIEFVHALRSYDPSKGALGTYVYQYLNKGKRWIAEHQNVGRIPENRIYKITPYNNAVARLTEELGREPNEDEVADELGWNAKEVSRMAAEQRKDLVLQAFEEDPSTIIPSKTEEVLKLFKYELSGEQKEVYEYLTGFGKPRLTSTSDIAKKLGIKDYQVSRIKSQIEKKLKRYING